MRTIIAGSRSITDMAHISEAVDESGFDITEVVSGCADGIDKLGEEWANWMQLPVRRFPADWKRNGKSAGYRRNEEMARYADALIAIWDGSSKGTKHMIDTAMKNKTMLIWVVNLKKEGWKQNELPLV